MPELKQYAVFREPNHILVGIEPDTFNVIKLSEIYGSGVYQIGVFHGSKQVQVYHQTVDNRLGPPKKTEPLPETALPSA